MPLRTLCATRYVTPLREGGSLPAIVEADDDGLYVLKFRGAGQGPKALVAELHRRRDRARGRASGARDRALELDADLARTRARPGDPGPDPRQRRASTSASTILPGAVAFDPLADRPDARSRRPSCGSTRW